MADGQDTLISMTLGIGGEPQHIEGIFVIFTSMVPVSLHRGGIDIHTTDMVGGKAFCEANSTYLRRRAYFES